MRCSRCGAAIQAGARYCGGCGLELSSAAVVPAHEAGERRLVSALFMDTVGSTALAERLGEDDWAEIIHEALDRLTPLVYEFGGTVSELLGDGMLAIFGAPVALENHAVQAARAGLRLLAAAEAYAQEIRSRKGIAFQVRIGINSGRVVLGEIGSSRRHEYKAIGDTLNLAARTQSMAEPMTVLVTESTRRLLGTWFDLKPVGALHVKGKSAAVPMYRLERERPRGHIARRQAHRLRGREAELARLRQISLPPAGFAFVSVIGEPGIGKSRLVTEWLAATEGNRRIAASCLAHETGRPFALLDQLFTGLGTSRESAAGPETSLLAGHLAEALNTRPSRAHLLIVEDAHWADAASAAVLRTALPLLAHAPLVICCTARPEPDTDGWALIQAGLQVPGAVEIQLKPLNRSAVGELLADLLGEDRADPLLDAAAGRAQGNPFFIEEIVAATLEGDFETPPTVIGLLEARLDRLPDEAKRAARAAAVLGPVFPTELLERLLAGGVEPWVLRLLTERGLMRPAKHGSELAFRHALVQEAAYGSLVKRERARLHARAGELLELEGAESAAVARHYQLAGLSERAYPHLVRAADEARTAYAPIESARLYAEAIAVAPPGESAGLRERRADVLLWAARNAEARAELSDASADISDPRELARLDRKLGKTYYAERSYGAARSLYERALSRLKAAGEVGDREWLSLQLDRMLLAYFAGSVSELATLVEEVEPHLAAASDEQRLNFLSQKLTLRLREERQRPSPATLELARAALSAADDVDNAGHRAGARFRLGFCLLWMDRLDEAASELRKALETAVATGDARLRVQILTYLAVLWRRRSDTAAVERLVRDIKAVGAAGDPLYVGMLEAAESWLALRSGRLAEAEASARSALTRWTAGEWMFSWVARWPLLALLARTGRSDEARAQLELLLSPAVQPLPDELIALARRITDAGWAELLAAGERLGYG